MATHSVPGKKPENQDVLARGCWAEHNDGSLLIVHGIEEGTVVYSLFGARTEWSGRMEEDEFKTRYSFSERQDRDEAWRWLWHDKTPFPSERIVNAGMRSSENVKPAAQRVAEALGLRARSLAGDVGPQVVRELKDLWGALQGKLPD